MDCHSSQVLWRDDHGLEGQMMSDSPCMIFWRISGIVSWRGWSIGILAGELSCKISKLVAVLTHVHESIWSGFSLKIFEKGAG